MPLAPGEKLGPYEVLAKIGEGGMGEVYEARDSRLGRDVAIKISAQHFSERFEREARAIAALNHPNICTLHDVGPNFLVMELVEGAPLKGPLPLEKTIAYAGQILGALDHAHRRGITHRDLKPANVLVTKQGIKLLDFGLAKLKSAPLRETDETLTQALTKPLTQQGQILGTLQYMAPEQLQGKEADARSDIFSFGCVLYEMLTGKRAFDGANTASVIAAILERPAPSVSKVAPAALDRVLKKCLAKDPDDRWQTARDLKDELQWVMSGPGQVGPPVPMVRPRPIAWIAAVGVLAVIAAALGAMYYGAKRPAVRPLMNLRVDLGSEAAFSGATARVAVALSPDGSRLAYLARGSDGKEMLATRLLDQAKGTLLPGTEYANDPFFSPDGQWIGFFADNKLKKISVQGGSAVTLCETAGTGRGGTWGEDGNIIFAPIRGPLLRIPSGGGIQQPLTRLDQRSNEITHRYPQFLPGGKSVLYTAGNANFEEATIQVFSIATGQTRIIQRDGYFGRFLATGDNAGYLLYVHQGTVFAVTMDPETFSVSGSPTPVLEDVVTFPRNGAAQFDFSDPPNGRGSLVYVNGGPSSNGWMVTWLDAMGKTQPAMPTRGTYFDPAVSPDGNRLAYGTGAFSISVYDLRRDFASRVAFTPGSNDTPVWTPDGRGIVYRSISGSGASIYWVKADGSTDAVKLFESKNLPLAHSFSPDGKQLAFHQQGKAEEPQLDLWTLPIDWTDRDHPKAGPPQVFLRTPVSESMPAFSPDGRWLAYQSNEGSSTQVFVRPYPANASGGKWQISTEGGQFPVWSRNGQDLFFEAPDGSIMVVEYTVNGATFSASKPKLWARHPFFNSSPLRPGYALHPDGKHFAILDRADAGQKSDTHVTLLLNFSDELRRRIPPK